MNQSTTILVNSQSTLDALVLKLEALTDDNFISLDTEFTRIKTYYPMLNLIQIYFDNTAFLVDPMSDCLSISHFIKALVQTKATVLFFSGEEDLDILNNEATKLQLTPSLPNKCVDIQLMMAFLNISYSQGLQSTLLEQINVDLPKDQTLSDWVKRPLSQDQIMYAANDVIYLKPLYDKLISQFKEDDIRLSWFYEEMDNFKLSYKNKNSAQTSYLSISGAGALNIKDLNVLKYLCAKRYELATINDEALNRIITTKSLCPLARQAYVSEKTLPRVNMKWGAIKEYGSIVCKWHKEARQQKVDEDILLPYDYFSSKKEYSHYVKELRHFLTVKAEEHNIRQELLCNKQIANDFFYSLKYGNKPKVFTSWYQECIGITDLSIVFSEPLSL